MKSIARRFMEEPAFALGVINAGLQALQVAARVRLHPHSLRHAHAVELWREKVDLYVISRQLGHANIAVTAHYLASLAPFEILEPIGQRRAPVMAVHDLMLAA